MDWHLIFALVFGFKAEVFADYGECPFAQIKNGYIGYATDTSLYTQPLPHSYLEGHHTNQLNYRDAQYTSNLDTTIQRLFNDESSQKNKPILSENKILSSFFLHTKNDETPACAAPPQNCANDTANFYYRSIDGSCNNLEYPGWGMANSRYGRLLPPKYDPNDGYSPTTAIDGSALPNARMLSLSLYEDNLILDRFHTLSFMQWGQIVAHDLSKLSTKGAPADCCSNADSQMCYPITLHPHGPIASNSNKNCISFARAVTDFDAKCQYNPCHAEKISTVTAFLDMSSVYGNSVKESKKLRQFVGGLLKTSFINQRQWLPISLNDDGECGEENYKCYRIPDRRNQFLPSITVVQTVLLREHNRIACALSQLNPHYSDEKIFQEARKINIAQYQKIIYYEWLPLLVGSVYAYSNRLIYYTDDGEYVTDYDGYQDPAPIAESAAAALRYAHTQIPGYFSLVTENRLYNETKRLSEYFEQPSNIDFLTYADNFDSLIRGMITQPQKRSDNSIDKEIKHYFNRKITDEFGGDLKSFDIQRARDYGIPSYNDLREYCGLPRAYDWSDFTNNIPRDKIELLKKIYAHPDDVELSVGGSLELHVQNSLLGPTFQCIVGKQFLTARISDRFFFENENVFSGFSREQLAEIRKASLSRLYCNNGDYLQFIQPNSFILPNPKNHIRSCSAIPQINLEKWRTVPTPIY